MKEFTKYLSKEFDKDYLKVKHKKLKSKQALDDMVSYYHKKWVKLLIESKTPRQKELCHCFLSYLIRTTEIKLRKMED